MHAVSVNVATFILEMLYMLCINCTVSAGNPGEVILENAMSLDLES